MDGVLVPEVKMRVFGRVFRIRFDILLLLFFFLVFIRISLGEADSEEGRVAAAEATANGDIVKQLLYTSLFISLALLWVRIKGFRCPDCASAMQIILLTWILLSTTWAEAQGVSFRRAVLLIFVFGCLTMSIDLIGPEKSMQKLYVALATCVTLSLICVVLFPSFAVHPSTELDATLAGGWRGLFIHKNTAGAVAAMSSIIFFHYGINRRKWYDWFFFVACIIFLLGCKAKTPLGLLVLVLPLSVVFLVSWNSIVGRVMFLVLMVLTVATIAAAAMGFSERLAAIFADPTSFTGRVAIWKTAFGYADDHFWLGSGYNSLWGVAPGPVLPYITDAFLEFTTHSHSGYVEMLSTTGIIGISIAVFAAAIMPSSQISIYTNEGNEKFFTMIFALVIFGLLEKFMESQLYTRDREI